MLCVIGVTAAGAPAAAQTRMEPGPSAEASTEQTAPSDLSPLTAPDMASARTIARLQGEPVEILGERTVTGSVFAMPDGTFAAGRSSGPVWVPRGGDGTQEADWAPVDLALVQQDDGSIAPVAHIGDLTLSGGTGADADPAAAVDVASMTSADGVESSISWQGALPAPSLDGPRATYAGVRPGVDMVIEATTTGFEQFFVLHEPPTDGAMSLPVIVSSDDSAVSEAADGSLQVTDAEGAVIASSPEPMMWDAQADQDRVHPVTEAWRDAGGQTPRTPPADLGGKWDADLKDEIPLGTAAPTAELPATARSQGPVAPPAMVEQVEVERTVSEADGGLRVDLAPQASFLTDPGTQYPVVVDPQMNLWGGIDTYVQSNQSSDLSTSYEMVLGTWDGGSTVARSFINFDPLPIRGANVFDAKLVLMEYYSYSCQSRNWRVWATNPASTSTRWNSQPTYWGHWATSSETRGYSSACPGGGVAASITGLAKEWAKSAPGTVFGVGLTAENEADNYGLKRFYTSEVQGQAPWVWVSYDFPPSAPSALSVSPTGSTVGGVRYVNSTTPRLSATVTDPDGTPVRVVFQLLANGAPYREQVLDNVPSGSAATWDVPGGLLVPGTSYSFQVQVRDANAWTAWVVSSSFQVDASAPGAPSVTSTTYPSDGTWAGDANQDGTFTLKPAGADASLVSYRWALDKAPDPAQTVTALTNGNDSTLTVKPTTAGRHVLQVQSVDRAGNTSAVVKYIFHVGTAGITAPDNGSQVVRRARIFVGAKPEMKYVKFEWRRGPDSTTVSPAKLELLSTSSGEAWTSTWQALPTGSSGYTTWDLGAELAWAGPIQIRAQVAAKADGEGAVPTAWTSLTVDPAARGASTTTIGPGAVNLLTGDHTFSVTDVEEFGMQLARTASSRDADSGYQLQAERLSESQQQMTALTGITAGSTTMSVATDRYHAGTTSLKLSPNSGVNDSWAAIGGNGGVRLGMEPGHTYRVSGWVNIASTGNTSGANGMALKLAVWSGVGSSFSAHSAQANIAKRDQWQYLTFDAAIPANATEIFLRAYNGYPQNGPAVYWDDITVREIFAPLGPQWNLGSVDGYAGTAYTRITRPADDVVAVHTTGGGEIWFTSGNGQMWWPEPGAESLKLTGTSATTWRLTELDGTYTDFAKNTASADYPVIGSAPPGDPKQSRHVYTIIGATSTSPGVARLTRIIAPIEPGVDASPGNTEACNTAKPAVGCEVMDLDYATTTTAVGSAVGTYTGRISTVSVWTWSGTAMVKTPVASYAYDAQGRLRQVHDPRIVAAGDLAQVSVYDYDSAGRLTSVTPPGGQPPYQFTYGTAGATETISGDWIDPAPGRLLKVSRDSLTAGTPEHPDPMNTTTLVYNVPLHTSAGGPYDLRPADLATWAQTDAPTDATAVFGPLTYPGGSTASASVPKACGPDNQDLTSCGYKPATVHYLNASGLEVNTAAPMGIKAPGQTYDAFIDTTEYDQYGNVVRTLDATNRLLALKTLPDAQKMLNDWGLQATSSIDLAQLLDTQTIFSTDGLDVLEQMGPVQRLAVANDPSDVRSLRAVTQYTYDEGKPDGAAYHLTTTTTTFGRELGTKAVHDPIVTKNGYDPVDGAPANGPTSGWVHKQPTTVTVDAGQPSALTSSVIYDERARAIRSSKPGSSGADAGTTLAVFYTAGANPADAACGNRPEWAGQPCVTRAAGPVTGHDPARMSSDLPVKRVAAYNAFGSPTVVTETVGSGAGQVVRTSTTTYDASDRVKSVALTATGPGAGQALPTTYTDYDPVTGDVTANWYTNASGAKVSVTKQYDALGRLTKYTDATGAWTTTTYDRLGQPLTVTDYAKDGSTVGSRSYTYDRALEPRGFVTKLTDSVAGDIVPTWGPDGQLESQTMPGGVTLTIGYDTARVPTSRTYKRTSDGVVIAADSVVENHRGQWISHTTTDVGVQTYAYDRLGRLTDATQSIAGVCTARTYGFDTHTNRTSFTTATGTTGAPCPTTAGIPVPVTSTYDSADRLVTTTGQNGSAWVYDQLGRITAMPTADGSKVASTGYFVNDLVATQEFKESGPDGTQTGEQTTWTLDPLHRFSQQNTFAWVNNAWANSTESVNHYDADGDEPSWIAEDITQPDKVSRYVEGADGNVALQTTKTGGKVLQLVDLHGDITATVDIPDGQSTADATTLRRTVFDEFGIPQPMTSGSTTHAPPARYGWLGAAQRSADTPTGAILMGVRLYAPALGRFLQVDPVAGGSANAYDYCNADPVNCSDLGGTFAWKGLLKAVAVVADISSSFIPGPVGAAVGGLAAGAYLVAGDREAAKMAAIGAAATLVGLGAAAGAVKIARLARQGQLAARAMPKIERALSTLKRSKCSFVAGTLVRMADGSFTPIEELEAGDEILGANPDTGRVSSEVVISPLQSVGEKHLIALKFEDDVAAVVATDNHPYWIEGEGWVAAGLLTVGDVTLDSSGHKRALVTKTDLGWFAQQHVYNLHASGSHTYFVAGSANGADQLVHNANPTSCPLVGTIVNQRGVRVSAYAMDHLPVHLHVAGNGPKTKIGPNGKPLKGFPELSRIQREVIAENKSLIRRAARALSQRIRSTLK